MITPIARLWLISFGILWMTVCMFYERDMSFMFIFMAIIMFFILPIWNPR